MYLYLHRTRPSAGFFIALWQFVQENRGRKLNVKLSVSKAELEGSNPSARAKFASEAEVDIAQDS